MGSSADSSVLAAQALAHLDSLHAFAFRLARDGATADDLVQETFARCLGHAASFQPGTNLKAWLFRILRNLYFDLFSLFVFRADGLDWPRAETLEVGAVRVQATTLDGFHILFWRAQGLDHVLVSDVSREELIRLAAKLMS